MTRFYFTLERVSKEYKSRSFETDISLGILESAIFDFLTATLNPSFREPVMCFMRSFIFDVTFRTTSPLLLDDALDVNDTETYALANTKSKLSNNEDNDDDRKEMDSSTTELVEKSRKRNRMMINALVKFVIMPIVTHSLVHSASSIISHDIFHILEEPPIDR